MVDDFEDCYGPVLTHGGKLTNDERGKIISQIMIDGYRGDSTKEKETRLKEKGRRKIHVR
jgi:hypothetical protein